MKKLIETKCSSCNETIFRERYRVLKGPVYCSSSCQMNFEYSNGTRNPKKITLKANETIRKQSQNKIESQGFLSRYIGKRGYYVLQFPNHKRIYEHHAIWLKENKLDKIPDDCDIHHINFNRLDNRIENLTCISKKLHQKLHYKNRKIDKLGHFV